MTLKAELLRRIAHGGPLTVAEFTATCLHHPLYGYYAARPGLGGGGDFITAPLVSQMFGELLGLWCFETWRRLGSPSRIRWVELGPGTGQLLQDARRALRSQPAFFAAADLWLIETSPPLRERQRHALGADTFRHAAALDAVKGEGPFIVLANEFFDCLPVRQFLRTRGGWAERRIGAEGEALRFGYSAAPEALIPPALRSEPVGAVVEVSSAQSAWGGALGDLVSRHGGAALVIDYGRSAPEAGDTLQALKGHHKVDPLAAPGEADLTAHVDFPAVVDAARRAGACVSPIASQGAFLMSLGLAHRAEALSAARPERASALLQEVERLAGPQGMGVLFKALSIHQNGLEPPGFESTRSSGAACSGTPSHGSDDPTA